MSQDQYARWDKTTAALPPRYSVTYRPMGWIAGTFHFVMMVCTMGLWTPVYLLARRGRRSVTRIG
jgi:hypothetical protein